MLFDVNPLPTFVFDSDPLRVVVANAAAEERYGYHPGTLKGLRIADLTDPDESPRSIATRKLPNGDTLVFERHRHRRKDGTLFPVYCATREFRAGEKRHVLLVVTELSELRSLDAEQRFTEKMEAMSRLGGGIAHTFNNLLTGILATTDLVLETANLAPSVRDDLHSVRETALNAATITRQLMAFSGSQSVSLRPTDVNQLLEQLRPLLENVLPSSVSLRLDLRSTGAVEVDPAHFEQIILNLALNAMEAMPDGGELTVSTADSHDFAAIVVADSGSGMDEVTLARLFEPFQSAKGPTGGRGLGLASVWGTVRQMGGSVDIESAPAKGTRVRLFFPRVAAPIELEFVSAPGKSDVTGGEVVLVVEDEPQVRAPICRMLRNLGYFVLEADHGEHALQVMHEHHMPVHLVISDVMMPEMDGTQLVALLRSWYPSMRVLFISGYSAQYLEAKGDTVDGSAFLAKPFRLEVLSQRVRELLDAEWSEEPG
jgi:hypothetical protein